MRLLSKKNGQSLVEFALIIPILIFMITLFIDVGRAIFTYSELANSVREGTRYAIVHPLEIPQDWTDVESIVLHYSPTLNPDDMAISFPTPEVPDGITISATYQFKPITPGLSYLLGSTQSITLEAHSTALIAPLYQ